MKTIVFKISGESLGDENNIYKKETIDRFIANAQKLSKTHKLAFVLGAGNIFRGSILTHELGVSESIAHYSGMLAIVNNGIVLRDLMQQAGVSVKLLSGVGVPPEVEQYSYSKAIEYIKENILLFAGGTGLAHFTSDTTSVHRAIEVNADLLVMVKSVDGVYTADPKTDQNAKKIDSITCTEILSQNLTFADPSAIALAREHKLPIKLVSMKNILNYDENIGTTIIPE